MPDDADHEDARPRNPGKIITAAPTLADEMGSHLYVVIDGFDDPRYTIARLGGDGHQPDPARPAPRRTPAPPGRPLRGHHAGQRVRPRFNPADWSVAVVDAHS